MSEPTSDRDPWELVAEAFLARYRAGERPSIEEYATRHPELADQIRRLMPALVMMEQDLSLDPARAAPPRWPAEGSGESRRLGDYRIRREIGRGGMGVVYEAEQVSLGRRVALKVLPRQIAGDGLALARFQREAKAAARLHHTNIVPVFEVGRDGEVAYYAMQFIQGQGLDQVIDELARLGGLERTPGATDGPGAELAAAVTGLRKPTIGRIAESILSGRFATGGAVPAVATPPDTATGPAATKRLPGDTTPTADFVLGDHEPARAGSLPAPRPAALLPGGVQVSTVQLSGRRSPFFRSVAQIGRQAAQGLAYAHASGLVHRDIKPSNLLLDHAGVVWIADFGLAKGDDEGLTQSGDILGTLRYMAPCRFRGEGDTRADIYALGLTLFELLTLRPAYNESDRLKLIDQIKNEEPPRPRSIDSRIPRDLETIVLKAIEKDPKGRYQSAEAMAEDLRRFLADEPIQARQVSPAERYWRWARRNPAIAILGGVVTALLVAVTIGSLLVAGRYASLAVRESNSASAEKLARLDADRTRETAEKAEMEANEQRTRADHEAEVAQQNLYYAQMHLAQQAWREHRGLPQLAELLTNWLAEGDAPDRRGWEWFYLNSLPYQNVRTFTESGTGNRPSIVAWLAAGNRLAQGTADGLIRIWDVDRGQLVQSLRGQRRLPNGMSDGLYANMWLACSPDGRNLAAAFTDGTVHVWEVGSGRELQVFRGHKSPVLSVAYRSDGLRLAAWGENGTIKIWDANTGRLTEDVTHPRDLTVGAWSRDDKRLASGHIDGTVTISGTHGGDRVVTLRGQVGRTLALAWSPDSTRLASTGVDQSARIWEVASEKMILGPLRHSHWVTSVAWAPDGQSLATGSLDYVVKIWNATTGHEDVNLRGHLGIVTSLAWSPDGRLASGDDFGRLKVWDAIRDQESSTLPGHSAGATSVSWSPDGRRLASAGDDGKIRIWDPTTRREVLTLKGHNADPANRDDRGTIRGLAWSPDGMQLASGGLDGTARVWDVACGREAFTLPADHGLIRSVTWSPDGTHLAAGSEDGTIRVVEGLKQTPRVQTFQAHGGAVCCVAWSPKGDRLASGEASPTWSTEDAIVKLWDPIRGTELARMNGHTFTVWGLAWSPDGKRLASAGAEDHLVITWDPSTGQKLTAMHNHTTWVEAVAWSPDGTRLASASRDNTVRISDPRTGKETLVLRGSSEWFRAVSWHPDGARLAAASRDGQIWIWDATRGFERDTTPRALPYIDRKVASGTARGEDLCWYAESYIRAGKPRKAMAVVRADRDRLRELLAKLPAEQRTAFARLWAEDAKTAGPANNAERLAFAQIASDLERFAFSTRLWAEALASDPKLGDDPRAQPRYNAARAAALAAAGQGRDEPPLDDAAKARLRAQALDWLKAELLAMAKLLESGPRPDRPAIAQTLKHWQQDSDLAGIRDAAALAKLAVDEQKAFTRFWAKVESLLKKAEEKLK